MKAKDVIFVGCHNDDQGQPLIVVAGEDGEKFEVGTVAYVEGLIARYRAHVAETISKAPPQAA